MSIQEPISDTSAPAWRPDQPWNALRALEEQRERFESMPILRACIGARAALAELKQAAELIPNQDVLIGTIPLLEAQASSEIENIVTTHDRLFRLQRHREDADPASREAFRYRNALLEGFRTLKNRPLTPVTAEQVCSRLAGREVSVRSVSGTTLMNPATREVVYAPPEGEDRLRTAGEDRGGQTPAGPRGTGPRGTDPRRTC